MPQPAPAPAPVVQAPAPQREDLVRYTIVAGDTTSTIADRHGSTVAELRADYPQFTQDLPNESQE